MKLQELYGFVAQVFKGDKFGKWQDLFGIELELENLNKVENTNYWLVKEDQSLRNNGFEYILRYPAGGSALNTAIDEIYNHGLTYTNGPRTSTHIHVTAGDMTVDNLRSMMVMMYTLEDALFDVIGETRKWAGYAVPLTEMNPKRLQSILNATDQRTLIDNISPQRNQERYYGLNVCCHRHGTIEFRYFPGGPTKQELSEWVDLVASVKKASMTTTVDFLLNLGNNRYELEHWLRAQLPAYWVDRLLAKRSVDQMLEKFLEVIAFCADPGQHARQQQIVFVTKPLITFIRKNILGKEGMDYLTRYTDVFGVLTLGEWQNYMINANDADYQARNKSQKVVKNEGWLTVDDNVDWEIDAPAQVEAPVDAVGRLFPWEPRDANDVTAPMQARIYQPPPAAPAPRAARPAPARRAAPRAETLATVAAERAAREARMRDFYNRPFGR